MIQNHPKPKPKLKKSNVFLKLQLQVEESLLIICQGPEGTNFPAQGVSTCTRAHGPGAPLQLILGSLVLAWVTW